MISIIVTAYNVEKYISQCLESCLNQNYKDIEIIVIDDGSIDNTAKIILNYCEHCKKIKFIHQNNSGVSVARNRGMSEASGDFIMFVDGDDYLDENILTKLSEYIDIDIDIIACCCSCVSSESNNVEYFFDKDYVMCSLTDKERLFLQLLKTERGQPNDQKIFTGIGVPWGKLYRRSFLEKYGFTFNVSLKRMQDNIFNMYAFYYANKIVYINVPLYFYRVEHINTYRKHYSPEIYYLILEERIEFFNKHNDIYSKTLKEAFYYEKMDCLICSLKNICKSHKYKDAKGMMKSLVNTDIYYEFIKLKSDSDPMKLYLVRGLIKLNLFLVIYLTYKLKP